MLEIILINFALFMIGYLIGSCNWSIILSKQLFQDDVRSYGSGNAGGTNMARKYGKKIGLLVVLLDIFKLVIPCLIVWIVQRYTTSIFDFVYLQVVGVAIFLGHIFPLYFHFKGGKGAACFGAFVIVLNPIMALICLTIFILIAYFSRIVSLASICTALLAVAISALFAIPTLNNAIGSISLLTRPNWWVNTLALTFLAFLLILKHLPNIKRLLAKNERHFNNSK